MEWLPWIFTLLQGVCCFCIGYRVGRDDNDNLSEKVQVEIKKYYWDHPKNGGTEDRVNALLTDNARLQEAYDAMSRDLERMTRDRDKFRDLYLKMTYANKDN